jgi:pteridine reductase
MSQQKPGENSHQPRVALVTGAGRRIGATIAKYLHHAGFSVVIHCHHSEQEAQDLCHELLKLRPNSARVLKADLSQQPHCITLVQQSIEWGGQLDVLVNNASQFISSSETPFDSELWHQLFTINVQAPYWLSHAAKATLQQHTGVIINITDIHAETPLKGYAEYCQTKAALAMQTKSLAREFAPHIRVNAVAPGAIDWPEKDNSLSLTLQQKIVEKTLLKRHGESRFVAQAIMALVENPFITGQTLRVDGGRMLD